MIAPGLIIAAPRSGSGKTVVTLGLQRAFVRAGLTVAGAKSGPDYIDPAFHAAACGRDSVNLDGVAMRPDYLLALADRASAGVDLVIAEGAMGLFDGISGGRGSAAALAALTGWPVVLVIDVTAAMQTAAAMALGCTLYDPRIAVAGVILNRVASPRHLRLVADGFAHTGIPILGAIGKADALALPERHLGLVQAGETGALDARLDAIAAVIAQSVDLGAVRAAARPLNISRHSRAGGNPWTLPLPDNPPPMDSRLRGNDGLPHRLTPPGQRIAVARDEAFSFLYPHLLTGWRDAGAEVRFFSPLAGEAPPEDCDCCWLPGGYPELHAGRIAAAAGFLDGLRHFAGTRPVHGECGGYMVLGQSLQDADGVTHGMAGLLPVETSFRQRRLHLGYRTGRLRRDAMLGGAGATVRGHEFHYASVTGGAPEAGDALFDLTDGEGAPIGLHGHRVGRVSGAFLHLIA